MKTSTSVCSFARHADKKKKSNEQILMNHRDMMKDTDPYQLLNALKSHYQNLHEVTNLGRIQEAWGRLQSFVPAYFQVEVVSLHFLF